MKYILNITTGVILALAALTFIALYVPTQRADSAGYFGSPVFIQTSGTSSVGGQRATTIFPAATNNDCKSRVITTGPTPIRLSFGDYYAFATSTATTTSFIFGSTSLSASIGHFQAASTTVTYDAGLYGCGLFAGLALGATTTVTVTSF